MTKILYGKPIKEKLGSFIKEQVQSLKKEDISPGIGIVRIGENGSDIAYERGVKKSAQSFDIDVRVSELKDNCSTEEVVSAIRKFNDDSSIGGILVLKPLPGHLDEDYINEAIDPRKDADCIHPLNLAKVFGGREEGFLPCTPWAVIKILEEYGISLQGKKITIINRSLTVGKPLSMLLLNKNATITIAHSKTENLKDISKNSDIICTATGASGFLTKDYVSKDSIIMDIGVSFDSKGKMSGDADFSELENYVSAITPVPRGVGSITNTLLLLQSLKFFK